MALNNDPHLRQYLLGGLESTLREEFEGRLFSDPDFVDALDIAEDELVDDFVRGQLPENERSIVESLCRTSLGLSRKVEFSRALLTAANRGPARLVWPKWASAAAVMLLAASVAATWYLMRREGLPEGPATPQVADSIGPKSPVAYAWVLEPGRQRGESSGVVPLRVPPGTEKVLLTLTLPNRNESEAPRAVLLETAEGGIVWRDALSVERGAVSTVATIPAQILGPGDYILRLEGYPSYTLTVR